MRRLLSLPAVALLSVACSTSTSGTTGTGAVATSGATSSGTAASGTSSGAAATSTTSGSGSGGLTVTQLLSDYGQILCALESRCGLAAYAQAECPSIIAASLLQVDVDLDAGLTTYDAAAGAVCVGTLQDSGCDFFDRPNPCPNVFVGTVQDGGACYTGEECVSSFCNSVDNACPGYCVPYVGLDQDCSSYSCDPTQPLTCTNVSDGGYLCLQDSVVGLGAACASPGNGAALCGPGLFCPDNSATPTCASQVGGGGVCIGAAGECAGANVCVGAGFNDGTNVSGVCLPGLDVGGACVPTPVNGDAISGCLGGLACVVVSDGGAICEIPPTSGPCAGSSPGQCMGVGYYCDPSSDTCLPKEANGATCDPNDDGLECQSGYCNPDTQTDGGACWAGCLPP